jgi:hypothetical protein
MFKKYPYTIIGCICLSQAQNILPSWFEYWPSESRTVTFTVKVLNRCFFSYAPILHLDLLIYLSSAKNFDLCLVCWFTLHYLYAVLRSRSRIILELCGSAPKLDVQYRWIINNGTKYKSYYFSHSHYNNFSQKKSEEKNRSNSYIKFSACFKMFAIATVYNRVGAGAVYKESFWWSRS